MSPRQAAMIFEHFGVTMSVLATPAGLKAARNRLLMAMHSDHTHGDTDEITSSINAAYDVLKRLPQGYLLGVGSAAELPLAAPLPGSFYDRPTSGGTGPTARQGGTAAHQAAPVPQFRDEDEVRQYLAGLTSNAREEYLIYYYDGSLRPGLAVLGTPDLFANMAQAVASLHGRGRGFGHRAVFVERKRTGDLLLVSLNGRELRRPLPFGYDNSARSPSNDQQFQRMLPSRLAAIAKAQQAYA